ncbi:1-deoxy-D-xylulose-5-phosphate reductoisomerase [Helicovermis profundi]|uniref:1-deoxy-D-xylulose 5-phosphate reductoisomerase n=1 Tax=Helicovermis profundi TaxID=3065157 RepID=A0AAU9E3X8_9FIRM|nr:1-deoxy-D-xylulose-5-phosphate reductoisomerase [Clostridia bacterium S502]
MINLVILGSTGSIGTQTLEVARENREEINILAISCNRNIEKLYSQIKEFTPKYAVVYSKTKYLELKNTVKLTKMSTEILHGMEGLNYISKISDADTVVSSLVGNIGLVPTVTAIKEGKRIALANKEVLVTSGELIMKLAEEYNSEIIPVDSEHSAIFQCLRGNNKKSIDKIILTASGGPFNKFTKNEIIDLKANKALKHPNWSMGKKISIDSATLMNKGLEVIEAKWLFDVELNQIDVVVHPESIVHSLVQYKDSSVIAQMGLPDMKLPIQYALFYPNRMKNDYPRLNLAEISKLTFEKPDLVKFPCLNLAFESLRIGGTMTTVLNAANEVLVDLYLKDKIKFYDIPLFIESVLEKHKPILNPTIDDILGVDKEIRKKVFNEVLKNIRK